MLTFSSAHGGTSSGGGPEGSDGAMEQSIRECKAKGRNAGGATRLCGVCGTTRRDKFGNGTPFTVNYDKVNMHRFWHGVEKARAFASRGHVCLFWLGLRGDRL